MRFGVPSALRGTFGVGYDAHCALAGAVTAASPISNKVVSRRIVICFRCGLRIEAEKIPYSAAAIKPTRLTLRIVAMGA